MIAPGTRVLVTGASGFIGSHLVVRLAQCGADVRAVVRSGVAALPGDGGCVTRLRGDVVDITSLQPAVDGCDVIFHCAWGGASLDEARRVNVQGTRNVVESSARAGVRRVVHVSSVAVHGRDLPPILTEECPLRLSGHVYGVSKAEGEMAAFEVGAARGLEIVALRPPRVYGPRAPILMSYFERCRVEELALVNGGQGLVNLVHVDDLVEAMLIAAQRPGVAGEAFLVNGPEPVTWREYIGQFARMLRKPLPPSVPLWQARLEVQWSRVCARLIQRSPRLWPMDLDRMVRRTSVSIGKARRLLGWEPRLSLDRGMALCEAWLRKEGYLPAAGYQGAAGCTDILESVAAG